jgi:16S rRNA (guanine527-N7)-methyltransferase
MTHPLATELEQGQQALGLALSPELQARLLQYLDLIGRWNRVYNLTAIRDPQAMLVQHLLDCLAAWPALRRHLADAHPPSAGRQPRLLDVGSGAGLPGVILALCEPGWSVTCVDTVGKKASFIRQAGLELGLNNLQVEHQRVEALRLPAFDLITSRAFASLLDFVQLTRAHLAPHGVWVAMKAHLTEAERQAVPADVAVFHVEHLEVPQLAAQRCLVWLRPRAA